MGPVGVVVRLGPRRWLFLLRVVVVASLVELGIRALRLPRTARWAGLRLDLEHASPVGAEVRDPRDWALLTDAERERCDLALRVLVRGPFDATCLRRSLLLGHLLRRRDPILRLGVAKQGGAVAAHAWLEIDGVSLDTDEGTYRQLAPAARARGTGASA